MFYCYYIVTLNVFVTVKKCCVVTVLVQLSCLVGARQSKSRRQTRRTGGEGPLILKHLPASHCVKQMSRTVMTMNSSRRYLASFVFGKDLGKGLALTDSRLNSNCSSVHTVLQVQFCLPCDTLIFPYQDRLFVMLVRL